MGNSILLRQYFDSLADECNFFLPFKSFFPYLQGTTYNSYFQIAWFFVPFWSSIIKSFFLQFLPLEKHLERQVQELIDQNNAFFRATP